MAPLSVFEKALQASRPEDVLQELRASLTGEHLAGPGALREADAASRRSCRAVIEEMRRLSPQPRVADLLLLEQELQSFKSYVKRRHLGMDVPPVESRHSEETWEQLWAGAETDLPPAFAAVAQRTRSAARPESPGLFDAAFDSSALRALCETAEALGNEFIAEHFSRFDTVKGVELLWRARLLGMPQESQQALATGRRNRDLFMNLLRRDADDWPPLLAPAMDGLPVEDIASARSSVRIREFVRAADHWLMDFVREARMVTFGPERVFGCIVGLLAEAHNVGLVGAGRANGIAPDVLRPHLKATYV